MRPGSPTLFKFLSASTILSRQVTMSLQETYDSIIATHTSFVLLGPPELYPSPNPKPQTQAQTPPASGHPFTDLLAPNFNNAHLSTASPPSPRKGFTENNSPTYLSTGNPCLDFFFHVVPDTPPESLTQRLQSAWAHDPLTTLKLVCNLRGVRGTGKSDKEGFHTAAIWLFDNHPRTLARNVGSFARFGYFKDLPEILYRILEGRDVRQKQKEEWLGRKNQWRSRYRYFWRTKLEHLEPREVRVSNANTRDKQEKEKAREARGQKRLAMAKKLVERYNSDGDFRLLYNAVAQHFADCLRADLEFLRSGKTSKISLAAKWCPSLDSSFDRATLLCESIARLVFPREGFPEYDAVEEPHYAYRIRDRLRKDVLVPLRKVLELPEVYMTANQWGSIPYNRVASVAMKLYKDRFMKRDEERFKQYLADVKAGKASIAAGALLPHTIIASLDESSNDGGQVAELQWKRMVDDLSKSGKLDNCIAICDVSGSMIGTAMEVSVALGLLVSELSKEPWKGHLITFSENPELHAIQGDSLHSKTNFIRSMKWGLNTNFQRVFDRILDVAVEGKLKAEDMVRRVFVFSDMEFDTASENPWETDYEAIERKFRERGYGAAVPQVVFWNLRESKSTPVGGAKLGVSLLSGFSKNLLKLFLDRDGDVDPILLMEGAISGKEYQNLVVVD